MLRSCLFSSAAAAVLLTLFSFTAAQGFQTVTVDDADISISYVTNPTISSSRWTAVDAKNGVNTTCNAAVHCFSGDLDLNQVKDETWHEGSDIASATYRFTGVGVDVYFVFRNIQGDLTNVSFLIDDQIRGDMIQSGTANEWEYNYHAFGVSNLTNDEHTLTIQGGTPNLFILDYLTYTKIIPAPTTSSSSDVGSSTSATFTSKFTGTEPVQPGSKTNGGAIAGGIIGGLVVVSAGIFGVWCCMRRMRKRREKAAAGVDLTPPPDRQTFPHNAEAMPHAYRSPTADNSTSYSPYSPYAASSSPPMTQAYPAPLSANISSQGRQSLSTQGGGGGGGFASGSSASPSDPATAAYGTAGTGAGGGFAVANSTEDAHQGAPPPAYDAAGGSSRPALPPVPSKS